ncbi:MAG: RHS repeat-associated core domain-containing protein [Anaerolineales bacterium]|nr:RHS repeat-associated core domain-containing protein [Anaerolineales bacterium]
MQSNPDGSTTLFLGGGAYEVHIDGLSTEIARYYAFVGERILRDSSSNLHFLLTDHLGSVVAVVDASGNVEAQQRYAPYGAVRYDTEISETDFSYTGQRALDSVGLMDYNARWYSPSLGRFISADTIVPDVGNPQSISRYSYAYNNPLIFTDPDGHLPFLIAIPLLVAGVSFVADAIVQACAEMEESNTSVWDAFGEVDLGGMPPLK